jgi:DNA-binding NtrC family response regulator
MARLYQVVEKIAAQEMAVLITGETGTGKELLARAIHGRSLRARGPFMAVHCASLLGEIFESELFGAMAGAYTGAVEDRPGLLETLAGGTLLLDEVRQLSPEAQAKLLQVIDSGAFRRLGSAEPRVADVRFLASTSADLKAAVAAGSFRADLYYRLCAVEVRLPPLRERREDIGPLALHLLERHAQRLGRQAPSLTTECRIFLERQPWPGNVRQLEGVLLRALLTASPRGSLGANDLEPLLAAEENVLFDEAIVERHSLPELKLALERQYLRQVFLKCQGDPRRMMERLGLKRTRFYTWCRKLGLDLKDMRKRTPGR